MREGHVCERIEAPRGGQGTRRAPSRIDQRDRTIRSPQGDRGAVSIGIRQRPTAREKGDLHRPHEGAEGTRLMSPAVERETLVKDTCST